LADPYAPIAETNADTACMSASLGTHLLPASELAHLAASQPNCTVPRAISSSAGPEKMVRYLISIRLSNANHKKGITGWVAALHSCANSATAGAGDMAGLLLFEKLLLVKTLYKCKCKMPSSNSKGLQNNKSLSFK
jgi:hypothetical protein